MQRFDLAGVDFSFAPQRSRHAFNAEWRCAKCGFTEIFRIPAERNEEYALTVAKLAAYHHLRVKHPQAIQMFLEK
jgi:hypothetical protein